MIHRLLQNPIIIGAVLCLLAQPTSATDELIPDIDLLEFLGTIAGLESMGVEVDELLMGYEIEDDIAHEEVIEE